MANLLGGSLIQGYPLLGRAGTEGYIPKFSGNHKLVNSLLSDNGTNIGIGTTTPVQKLDVIGGLKADSFYVGVTQIIETDGKINWNKIKGNPTTLSGYAITDAYTKTNLQTSGQAQIHFGNLTNLPTAFTPAVHHHDDRYYTQSQVDTRIANLVSSAPAQLDTLNELAAALGNDANFAATVTTQLGNKADKATTYTKTELQTSGSASVHYGNLLSVPTVFPPAPHTHDDRYYTESEMDLKLNAKTDKGHTHTWSEVLEKPTTFPPTAHTHAMTDITGLDTALNGKLGTSANAASASKLFTARTISLTGNVTGSASFDGSQNISITATVANNSHSHLWSQVTSTPTTLSGYGITDAATSTHHHDSTYLKLTGGTLTGGLTVAGALADSRLKTGDTMLISADATAIYLGNGLTPLLMESKNNPVVYIGGVGHTFFHTGNFNPATKSDTSHNHDTVYVKKNGDSLNGDLNVNGNTVYHKGNLNFRYYKNPVTLGSAASTVSVGITDYIKATDMLQVFQNGVYIEEGQEYSIAANGQTITSLGSAWESGTTFNFVVTGIRQV